MGSDLFLSVDMDGAQMFDGPSTALARGIVVDAFGDSDPDSEIGKASGYLTHDESREMAEHEDCPWRLDEPYWVRCIPGPEFVAIVREKRWQRIQRAPDGTFDFHDTECRPGLRAFTAMVESLLADGCNVRVWCWHSQ